MAGRGSREWLLAAEGAGAAERQAQWTVARTASRRRKAKALKIRMAGRKVMGWAPVGNGGWRKAEGERGRKRGCRERRKNAAPQ
jgi:hypothetical protein